MTPGEAPFVPRVPADSQRDKEEPQEDGENSEERFLKFQYAVIDRWCAAFNRPDLSDHRAKKEPLTAFDWITAGYAAKCRALFDREKKHAALLEKYAEAMGWCPPGVADSEKLRSVWKKVETILYGEPLPEGLEASKVVKIKSSIRKKSGARHSKHSLNHAP